MNRTPDAVPAGPLGREDAFHLVGRLGYAVVPAGLERIAKLDLNAAVAELFEPSADADFDRTAGYLSAAAVQTRNVQGLKNWWLYRLLQGPDMLGERLTAMWHDHFATSNAKVNDVPAMHAQNELLRTHARGHFPTLMTAMAQDLAMLVWLDGNANRKRAPNENFAREILELFTLGIGNYTERDIKEAARAFSGWRYRGGQFWFDRSEHDDGVKEVLGQRGRLDGHDVVRIALEQPACYRFVAFKLCHEFLTHEPDDETIDAVAGLLRKHDFRIGPALRELVSGPLFWSAGHRRNLVKSPVDLMVAAARGLGLAGNAERIGETCRRLGQDLLEPPSVEGWQNGRRWLNPAHLLRRQEALRQLAVDGRFGAPTVLAEIRRGGVRLAEVHGLAESLLGAEVPEEVRKADRQDWKQSAESDEQKGAAVLVAALCSPAYQLR